MTFDESLVEFVAKRDVVIRGIVTKYEPDPREIIQAQQDDGDTPCTKMLTQVKIIEVLKNENRNEEFKEDLFIELVTYECEIRLSGYPVPELGFDGFWILNTKKDNYGFNSIRSLQNLKYEERIKQAIK